MNKELLIELIKEIRGLREELVKIEEAIRDCSLPQTTQINVRRGK